MREIQQRIRQYELMAVFSPDVTEEDLPGAIERVSGYIETAGGQVVSTNQESPWGRRRLAYAIRYQGRDVRDGYYVLYFFDIQSTQIAEIEREIGLNDKLIRHILTIRGEIPVVPEPEEGAEAASDGATAPQTAPPPTAMTAAPEAAAPVAAVEAPVPAADAETTAQIGEGEAPETAPAAGLETALSAAEPEVAVAEPIEPASIAAEVASAPVEVEPTAGEAEPDAENATEAVAVIGDKDAAGSN